MPAALSAVLRVERMPDGWLAGPTTRLMGALSCAGLWQAVWQAQQH